MTEMSKKIAQTDTQSTHGAGRAGANPNEPRVSELRASASLMRLEAGLYCVIVAASSAADSRTGLPGVRITQAPGPAGRPDAVQIRTIGADGWMSGFGDAALVRVTDGVAHVMVTIYQDPGTGAESAPHIQVLPLIATQPTPAPQLAQPLPPLPAPPVRPAPVPVDVIAHIRTRGDVGASFGEWLGEAGSGQWIEGFGITPQVGLAASDIEYQVVLGRGWVSPWVEGGQFAGSRGMNLPVLGLRVRLLGEAAKSHELRIEAHTITGVAIGPVGDGEACEAAELVPLDAVRITLQPRGAAAAQRSSRRSRGKAG